MTLVSDAMIFAARAHDGMLRKGTNIPYIVHPAEVAAIAATMTEDENVLAAALLHDVMEDCGVTQAQLVQQFGERVAQLVITPVFTPGFEEVRELNDTQRGTGGFGSTGK